MVVKCSGVKPGTADSLPVFMVVTGDLTVETPEETGSLSAGVYGMIVVPVTSNDVAKKGGTTVRSYAGGSLGVPTLALEDVGTTKVANVGHPNALKSEVTMVARLAGSDTTVALGDTEVLITSGTTVDEVVTGTTNVKMMVA